MTKNCHVHSNTGQKWQLSSYEAFLGGMDHVKSQYLLIIVIKKEMQLIGKKDILGLHFT